MSKVVSCFKGRKEGRKMMDDEVAEKEREEDPLTLFSIPASYFHPLFLFLSISYNTWNRLFFMSCNCYKLMLKPGQTIILYPTVSLFFISFHLSSLSINSFFLFRLFTSFFQTQTLFKPPPPPPLYLASSSFPSFLSLLTFVVSSFANPLLSFLRLLITP